MLAGEPSGDALGAALVTELEPDQAFGLVGPRLRTVGVEPIADISSLSQLGLGAPLRSVRSLAALRRHVVDEVNRRHPDVVVTIDAPSFLLRVAPALTGPVVHWVSPQLWVWRPHRAHRVARSVDALACLLPFEPALYRQTGLRAVFTGHPAADVPLLRRGDAVGLCAGSRPAERARLGPVFRRALRGMDVIEAVPAGCEPILPDAPRVASAGALAGRVRAALVCSGTATIELAAAGVPMVVAYATDRLTWGVGRRVVRVPWVALPNLLLGAPVVPEVLQRVDPDPLRRALERMLGPEGDRAAERLVQVRALLDAPHAIGRVGGLVTRTVSDQPAARTRSRSRCRRSA